MTQVVRAALLVIMLVLAGCARAGPAPSGQEAAPAFTLRQFNGQALSLEGLRGRTVMLNFWASWCVPCREEMPMFEEVWRAERERGLTFVGVAIQDDEPLLIEFIQHFGVTYPTGLDSDNRIALAYNVLGLPTTVFISPSGSITRRWQGPIDRERLLAFIAEARDVG